MAGRARAQIEAAASGRRARVISGCPGTDSVVGQRAPRSGGERSDARAALVDARSDPRRADQRGGRVDRAALVARARCARVAPRCHGRLSTIRAADTIAR